MVIFVDHSLTILLDYLSIFCLLSIPQYIFDIFPFGVDAVVELFGGLLEVHITCAAVSEGAKGYLVFFYCFVPTLDERRVVPDFFLCQCFCRILVLPHGIRFALKQKGERRAVLLRRIVVVASERRGRFTSSIDKTKAETEAHRLASRRKKEKNTCKKKSFRTLLLSTSLDCSAHPQPTIYYYMP